MLQWFQRQDRWEFTCRHNNRGLIEPNVHLDGWGCLTRVRFLQQPQFIVLQFVPAMSGFLFRNAYRSNAWMGREEGKQVLPDFQGPTSHELPALASLRLQIPGCLTLPLSAARAWGKLQYPALPIGDVLWNKKFLVLKMPKIQGLSFEI